MVRFFAGRVALNMELGNHMKTTKSKNEFEAEMMKVRDVADYLRLSEAKVYRMANNGHIPALRMGKTWRFKKEILDEWIRRETRGGESFPDNNLVV
jgi:excisionase family DNA binding protein